MLRLGGPLGSSTDFFFALNMYPNIRKIRFTKVREKSRNFTLSQEKFMFLREVKEK